MQLRFGMFALHHFVNIRRTKMPAGVAVFDGAAVVANVVVGDEQMRGLVFVVQIVGVENVRHFIDGQMTVERERRILLIGF